MKKFLVFAIAAIMLNSCLTTDIAKLKNHPEKFAGEVVAVKGEVGKVVNIPFTDYSFYQLTDSTDNILVFTSIDYKNGDNIVIDAKVIGYDSTNSEESTKRVIDAIEEFISNNIKVDEIQLKKRSEIIAKALVKALSTTSNAYLLIEQVDM